VSRPAWLPYAGLGALGLIWGASFLFIKVADRDMSPMVLVLGRVGSAAVTLAVLAVMTGRRPWSESTRRHLPALVTMAFIYAVVPWTLISWGELYIPSGLTSILNSTTPLFTALFAFAGPQQEKPTAANWAGIAIGFAGTVVLVEPSLTHGLTGSLLAAAAVLAASAAYAVSYIVQRRTLADHDSLLSAFWQMTFATVLMVPLAAPTIGQAHPHLASVASVLALGIVGSGLALAILYWMLNALGATRTASLNFLPPVSAVIYGALLLQEQVSLQEVVAMAIVLAGVFLVVRPRTATAEPAAARA
jgi:drug/metabolite transporter (DMT)-like permease